MATIGRFEDVDAWKEARSLVTDVYRATASGAFAKDFGLCDQIRRAAVSVMSNIAEGFERGSDRDFRRLLFVAKASAGEVRSLLVVAADVGYLSEEQERELLASAVGVSRRIGGFISYLDREIGDKKEA